MVEHVIRLPIDAGIGQTKALASDLLTALGRANRGEAFVIDASSLVSMDSAMAQLLVAFALEAESTGNPLCFRGAQASQVLVAALGAEQLDRRTAELLEASRE